MNLLPTYPKIYVMPRDAEEFAADFWTVTQAAAAWGVTRTTAYRRILRNASGQSYWVLLMSRRDRMQLCIQAGADPGSASGNRGNPLMRRPDWQRKQARRRWADPAQHSAQSARCCGRSRQPSSGIHAENIIVADDAPDNVPGQLRFDRFDY